jgi:hypothetical protein
VRSIDRYSGTRHPRANHHDIEDFVSEALKGGRAMEGIHPSMLAQAMSGKNCQKLR